MSSTWLCIAMLRAAPACEGSRLLGWSMVEAEVATAAGSSSKKSDTSCGMMLLLLHPDDDEEEKSKTETLKRKRGTTQN